MSLSSDVAERKACPIATGVLDYFPDAIAEVARVSRAGNEQHHPGQPLHWDRLKSTDEADALVRHLLERGTLDVDGQRHSAKVAWRALALLQKELEEAAKMQQAQESVRTRGPVHDPMVTGSAILSRAMGLGLHAAPVKSYDGSGV